MARKVTTIPATIQKFSQVSITDVKKRKVAGYARVSTDSDEQQTSYDAQVDYYTQYINSREDWEFVAVYTDEGISATNTKKRDGFNQMITDALNGKIDLIVTKSVSRFARNTVDSLSTIRKLKEHGTEVYFEKESIWTFDSKGELLITIMSSLAQEESRSISENVTWGHRKRMADGRVSLAYSHFLGYDKGKDGNLVVNLEQAKIVKRIFGLFLQGKSPFQIARLLTDEGVLTPAGKTKWWTGTVKGILQNEKYKGDALLQKSYTVDFLSKQKKKNEGEVPQYYVKNNHEAIIPEPVFDKVQRQLEIRNTGKNRLSSVSIFSSKIKCGCCGGWYGSKVWHSTSKKYRRTIWQCNHKFKNNEKCTTPHLTEEKIKDIFIKAVNKLYENKRTIIDEYRSVVDTVFKTDELELEKGKLEYELNRIAESIDDCIQQNARVVQDQEEYRVQYNTLVEKFENTKSQLEEVTKSIMEKQVRKDNVEQFLKQLKDLELITEFHENMWCSMVEHIIIEEKEKSVVRFKDGTEIAIETY